MNVDLTLQDILTTIHRNQQQIDLLTANNTQLCNYLLTQGLIQHLPHPTNGYAAQPAAGPLALPPASGLPDTFATPVKRRGRPPGQTKKKAQKKRAAAEPVEVVEPTERSPVKAKPGRKPTLDAEAQENLMLDWARKHEGLLSLAAFRAAYKGKIKVNASFWNMTIYGRAAALVKAGLIKKVGTAEYMLTGSALT